MRLYVNVDHVATLRQARGGPEPDPVLAAAAAEAGGADGITIHLREDRRHIQDRDVRLLAQRAGTVLNFELAAHPDIVRLACRLRPHQATLVPERRRELTTEGGLALRAGDRRLRTAVARLRDAGIRVSLFIDPARATVVHSASLEVPAIELHTGRYAGAPAGSRRQATALAALRRAARHARRLGLAVHAGHGLNYDNVHAVAAIADIEELNIGHSIVSHAVFCGLEDAVRQMRRLVDDARSRAV